jgi:flagellar biosynthesis/type III secretory pathway protein FliH
MNPHPRDCDQATGPMPGMPMQMVPGCDKEERGMTMERKKELMTMAMGIAAQVVATTTRRERCLLRSMVETFVND